MNRTEFIQSIGDTYKGARLLVEKKNQDYAGDNDPFMNFKNSECIGVDVQRGILVRMMDKVTRISNLLEKEAAVVDESIDDTIMDLCNYAAILKAYREHDKEK